MSVLDRVKVIEAAKSFVVLPETGRALEKMLSADSPLLAFLKEVELQMDGARQALSVCNFSSEEGRAKAISLQGKIQGLLAAEEILFDVASKGEEEKENA